MRHMKGTTLTAEEYEFLERVYLGLGTFYQPTPQTCGSLLAIINKLEDKIAELEHDEDCPNAAAIPAEGKEKR